uniref:Cyclin-dependent kinase inhibitor 1B-like n=1 Tax=Astyanax mexicanus TaxID=7994 RepID=A0A3B1KHS3_ASTMX
MSTVQIPSSGGGVGALASPRTFPHVHRDTTPRARVCRSLFGPVDHEELNREMKAKLREISERDQQRWNFNFGAGVPLLGEYEWEEAAGEASPAFYQECVRTARSRAAGASHRPAQQPQEEEDSGICSAESRVFPENVNENKSTGSLGFTGKLSCKKTARRKRPSPLTNTHITDFYCKRRSGVVVGGVKHSGGDHSSGRKPFPSAEQTPRKQLR